MLTILKLVFARYIHKPISTLLSIILFTIGVAVISLVMKSEWYLQNNYKQNMAEIDLVVGAKGSPLQLILSSVLHADVPTGNISLEEVHKIEKHTLVKKTIPLSMGDNYHGFRIVGTTTDYIDLYNGHLSKGELFADALDVVIGANVAKTSGLQIDDNFSGVHGVMSEGHSHDNYKYTVKGILKPTGTVIDNLVLTPLESVWMVHGSHHSECDHEDHNHSGACNHEHHTDENSATEHKDDEGCNHDHTDGHACNHERDEHVNCSHNHEGNDHDHTEGHACNHESDEHANCSHSHESSHETVDIDAVLHKIEHDEDLTEAEQRAYFEHKGILTDKAHDPNNEITALLVFYQNPLAIATLPRMINENTMLQAASPVFEFNRLLDLLGYGIKSLKLLAWIIIIISGINIFIYLLNSINNTIHEIALLRATGVSKPKIFVLILTQGVILSVIGWFAGIILSGIIWQVLPFNTTGVIFTSAFFKSDTLILIYCILVAVLASIIPALKIYNTKIHYLLNR